MVPKCRMDTPHILTSPDGAEVSWVQTVSGYEVSVHHEKYSS